MYVCFLLWMNHEHLSDLKKADNKENQTEISAFSIYN